MGKTFAVYGAAIFIQLVAASAAILSAERDWIELAHHQIGNWFAWGATVATLICGALLITDTIYYVWSYIRQ